MNEETSEMTDVVYDLRGELLPSGYVFELWRELVRVLPWLASEERAGILPLRGTERGAAMLLPQRIKMVLRVPQHRAQQAQDLCGQTLNVAGHELQVGTARLRPIQAHSTLHAHMVASDSDENQFLAEAEQGLNKLGITCKLICGKRVTWQGSQGSISGYSLVAHELKPEISLRLQVLGLGKERHHGCGIFVPYKAIAGLD
jgi:CRISPR-associated protein Cas6